MASQGNGTPVPATSMSTTSTSTRPAAGAVTAVPLQTMINSAVEASLLGMSESIKRMVQEAVDSSRPPPQPETTNNGGGSSSVSNPPLLGVLPGSTALSGITEMAGGVVMGRSSASSAAASRLPTYSVPAVGTGCNPTNSATSGMSLSSLGGSLNLPNLFPTPECKTDVIVVGASSPPVPWKLAQRIWSLKYVGMEELLPARLGVEPSLVETLSNSLHNKPSKKIESIEQWTCCFNTYIAVMSKKHPERVCDLLAYSSLIVNASRSYEGSPWLNYDIHFRKTKAADISTGTTTFASIDSSIWTLHFGGATARRVCSDCFEPGHTSCKLVEAPKLSQAKSKEERKPRFNPYPKSRTEKICWLFNGDGCNIEKDTGQPCCFRHICLRCKSEGHPVSQCPRSRTPRPSAFGSRR